MYKCEQEENSARNSISKKKTREELKAEILSQITPKDVCGEWFELTCENIDEIVINDALEKHKNVYIPYIGFPIVLHNPIVMSSDNHLKVSEYQVLMQGMDSVSCLLRNKNIQNARYHVADETNRDRNISIEGGIWNIRKHQRCKVDNQDTEHVGSLGSIILSSVENVSLKNMKIFNSYVCGPEGNTVSSYGIQLSNCKDFVVENIDFQDNHRDGVHIDGPAEYGLIRHIRGEKMGDDLCAMLAWDWYDSALTFGPIHHLYFDDIKGGRDEFRFLPGRKDFPDGTSIDCDIRNCVIENVSNLYTVKMYEQHNIENPFLDFDDSSPTVGNVSDIYFHNISFIPNENGFSGVPVNGFFDVCCNLENVCFENIFVEDSLENCDKKGICLIKVGPLTYVHWKFGEVFNPDSVCSVDRIQLKNITFAGESVREKARLVATVNQKKDDYRIISLGKGSGYGDVGEVILDE